MLADNYGGRDLVTPIKHNGVYAHAKLTLTLDTGDLDACVSS